MADPVEGDGSVEPKMILQAEKPFLDFARFEFAAVTADLASSHWGGNKHWWFLSLPEPIGVMYRLVATERDLEAQRFVVTVCIIWAEPLNYTDRQLSIRFRGFDLICEAL